MKKLVAVIAVAVLAAYGAHAEVHAGYILTDLGTLGGTSSYASGINAAGQIVGYAFTSGNAAYHAFLSNATPGGMTDLNSLVISGGSGWELQSATAINDNGQIVGSGMVDGAEHAFLLTESQAVPEPSTLVMWSILLGTLGVVWSYKRLKQPALAA